MKKLLLLLLLFAPALFGQDVGIFQSMKKVQMPPAVIHTISPSQIHAGIVTQLVVTGRNFKPRNEWNLPNVKILREQVVDSKTVILTVLAAASSPGLRSMSLE